MGLYLDRPISLEPGGYYDQKFTPNPNGEYFRGYAQTAPSTENTAEAGPTIGEPVDTQSPLDILAQEQYEGAQRWYQANIDSTTSVGGKLPELTAEEDPDNIFGATGIHPRLVLRATQKEIDRIVQMARSWRASCKEQGVIELAQDDEFEAAIAVVSDWKQLQAYFRKIGFIA